MNDSDKPTRTRLDELREIQRANGGLLMPAAVVAYATDEKTALHSAFCWDDTEAAHQYRIEQARRLIRVTVTLIEPMGGKPQMVRAFVSLAQDRNGDDAEGGYRFIPHIMRTAEGRAAVLETALAELEAFQTKYRDLKELSDVFAELSKLRKRVA